MPKSDYPAERKALGAALMIAAMFAFPIGDAAAKVLSDDYSAVLLSWIRFAVSIAALLPIIFMMRSKPVKISKRLLVEQVIRSVLIVAATVLFIAAIARIPLADTVGAYFTAPIIAALLAVVFLKEQLSLNKVIATVLGLGGMLLIVRPSVSLEIGFIYALLAGLCFGSYLVAIKWSTIEVPPVKTVAFQTAFGTIILLPFVITELPELRRDDLILFMTVGLASAVANMLTISALRLASASLLAPLVYFEIIGATVLGFIVFGDIPSWMTVMGVAVVILGGLLLIERQGGAKS